MICVSLDELYNDTYLKLLDNIAFAEIRMDKMALTGSDIREIFSRSAKLIATCRPGPLDDGGRKGYLFAAIDAGAAYVDVEVDSDNAYKKEIIERARSKNCKIIVSVHDYENTPSEERLKDILTLCFGEGADIVKIACKVNHSADNARLLGLLGVDGLKDRVVVVGMGRKGRIT